MGNSFEGGRRAVGDKKTRAAIARTNKTSARTCPLGLRVRAVSSVVLGIVILVPNAMQEVDVRCMVERK